MSQASPAVPVPCGTRAVTVFVLLLLVGVVGAQTRHSLECMAAGLTVQDTVAAAPRHARVELRPSDPMRFPDCSQRLAGQSVRVCLVCARLWPPPRGPDPSPS